MNYGYAPLAEADREAGPERFCASLYRQVVGETDLRGAVVLEVGSGRGGGSAFLKSRLGAYSVVGLDLTRHAVKLARRQHCIQGLSFVTGDAEALPFPEGAFDAVVSVESSNCYLSMDAFFRSARRVLRPGGRLLFADFRTVNRLTALEAEIERSGLTVLQRREITGNVAQALRVDSQRRNEMIGRLAPRGMKGLMREFAGVEGTDLLRCLESGATRYLSWVLAKV
jgi:SAM-dependent methyltransferase